MNTAATASRDLIGISKEYDTMQQSNLQWLPTLAWLYDYKNGVMGRIHKVCFPTIQIPSPTNTVLLMLYLG
jgi:hypothetical protein